MEIVFPKNNDQEFIGIAGRLCIKDLLFLYPLDKFKQLPDKANKGIICLPHEIQKAKKISSRVFVRSSPKDRFAIEHNKDFTIFDLETRDKKEFIHHRNSGLNQVLCKLMKANNISVGFSFSSILNSGSKELLIGRMKQNITFCKKYKLNMVFASFASVPMDLRTKEDMESFFRVI